VEEHDPSVVAAFAHLLTLARQAVERIDLERLTWSDLQTLAGMIAELRFGSVREKYRSDLYLQRQDVKQAFDDFLTSDKTAFLLLGKSGVGKSSFFLSLADEYQTQDQLCLLLYDGATLEANSPLRQIIGRDFATHLRLTGSRRGERIDDFLTEIAVVEGISDHKVILFIDAINESGDARTLLFRVNELIASEAEPWFKIVISSRPEAWRAIKRGLKLPEHRYYSLPGQTEPGVELQPFGVEMTNFTRLELRYVYEKYQQAYKIQTAYEEVPRDLQHLLNDPLTLKLVAETYQEQVIPRILLPGEIYEKYIRHLIKEGKLLDIDVEFLEEDLMPLMISKGHYDNKITAQQVRRTVTASGRPLRELIHNNEPLTNDRLINQSFRNLADTEILVLSGTSPDEEIRFKYERFYDYFGGKRIYELAATHEDRFAFFRQMIAMTGKQPSRSDGAAAQA
jgi:hypothetical protein